MEIINKHVSTTGMPTPHTREEYNEIARKNSENLHRMVKERNNYYVFRNIAMCAMIESILYMAQQDIFDISDIDEEQHATIKKHFADAIDYRDKCNTKFISSIGKEEDFMLDFQCSVIKKTKRKLTAFCNAVNKNARKIGVTQHIEPVAKIAVAMKLIETLNVYSNMSKQMAWYRYIKKNSPVERGLFLLSYCYRSLGKCLDILDPEMHKSPEPSKAIDKQFNDIIDIWSTGDLYMKSLDVAEKEEKLASKEEK